MKLSEFMKKERELRVMTQKQFGNAIGLSGVHISKIENGQQLSFKTLLKIVEYFGIDKKEVAEMSMEEHSASKGGK